MNKKYIAYAQIVIGVIQIVYAFIKNFTFTFNSSSFIIWGLFLIISGVILLKQVKTSE